MRHVRRSIAASILGRFPIGIAGLAILLLVQGRSGSFAMAGTASALYVLGLAIVAPVLGRVIDRLGPRPVLLVCAFLYPVALVALAILVLSSAPALWISTMALVAGATLPPISACTRALYPRLINDPALLQTAYSVDSALVELVFILGPTLVAVCVGTGHPEAAVIAAAASAAVGTTLFERSTPVRQWSTARNERTRARTANSQYGSLLVVYAATVLYAVGFGLFEVGVTAHAAHKGSPAIAGIALTFASIGSGTGAFLYGARHWHAPLVRQCVMALLAMAAGILVLVPVSNLLLFTAASVVAGLPMATVMATQSQLISRFTPRERLAESFTWSATCLLSGISAGFAAGGMMAERYAAYWLLVGAASASLVAAMLVSVFLRRAAVLESALSPRQS